MFSLAFSFANFETTKGNTVKANILHCPKKKLLLNFQNLQMKKRGETFFGECKEEIAGLEKPVHPQNATMKIIYMYNITLPFRETKNVFQFLMRCIHNQTRT